MAFTMSAVGSNAAYSEAGRVGDELGGLVDHLLITGMIPPAASACSEATLRSHLRSCERHCADSSCHMLPPA